MISIDTMTGDDMEITIDRLKDIVIVFICAWTAYRAVKNMMIAWKSAKFPNSTIVINSYFKIKQAVLCINCDTIFSREAYTQCPRCASKCLFAVTCTFEKEPIWKHTIQKPEGVTLQ